MTFSLKIPAAFLCLFFTANGAIAQNSVPLPRSTPEAEGVSSESILQFIKATAKTKCEFHSFMLLRHGKVIAEAWWNPYRPDLKHTLYSCSKSFTATAIGFAISEKKISLDDKIISFFPEDAPNNPGKFLSELTIKDALMMSDGQDPDPTSTVYSRDTNWIKGFLATPIVHEPGSVFLYNSLGIYMLSAIIKKVTGQSALEYLTPRLFQPLGISGEDWETDLQGNNTGAWGLRLKTEDMAKFAQLFLQKGKWNGQQLLSSSWVEDATTMKILPDPNASQSKKDSSDWLQGYCFQMWRCRHNAFRGDGAYGQFMIAMPDQDAVLAITAETPDMQEELNLVWQYILPGIKEQKLEKNNVALQQLKSAVNSLALAAPSKKTEPLEASISNKRFVVSENPLHLQAVSFQFSNDLCIAKFFTASETHQVDFAAGKWQHTVTTMPAPLHTAAAIENTSMLYPAKIASAYTWLNHNTLQLVSRYIESAHTQTYICHFDGDKVTIDILQSFEFGNRKITINGQESK